LSCDDEVFRFLGAPESAEDSYIFLLQKGSPMDSKFCDAAGYGLLRSEMREESDFLSAVPQLGASGTDRTGSNKCLVPLVVADFEKPSS
jgi:hypothetical protein